MVSSAMARASDCTSGMAQRGADAGIAQPKAAPDEERDVGGKEHVREERRVRPDLRGDRGVQAPLAAQRGSIVGLSPERPLVCRDFWTALERALGL